MRLCKIANCQRPFYARGWCNMHWQRWRKHGNPEEVKKVQSPQGDPALSLAEAIAYQGNSCLRWRHGISSTGYGIIAKNGRCQGVHILVCTAAHGPKPSPVHQVAHSCGKGDEGCVAPRHLRWATAKENHADKLIHGTHTRGEKNWKSILTAPDVLAIHQRIGDGARVCDLAIEYGVPYSTVSNIKSKHSWAWLTQKEGE